MPNWCDNELVVSGKAEDLKIFMDKFKGKPALYALSKYEKTNKTLKEIRELNKAAIEEHHNLPLKYCFNALYPVPKNVLKIGYDNPDYKMSINEKFYDIDAKNKENVTGYDWQILHWGTKWDIYYENDNIYVSGEEEILEAIKNNKFEEKMELLFTFCTAWSYPHEFFEKIAPDFPKLKFNLKYAELGCGFAGEEEFEGNTINTILDSDISGEYSEEIIDFIREHFYDDYLRDEDEEEENGDK